MTASFIDAANWPDKLTGRVAEGGPEPRIHGYAVEDDLARHYSFAEVALLSLTGELPEPAAARAFEAALLFLAPAPVGDGPSHAAVLAQACGAPPSGVIGTAAVALCEEARVFAEEHADLLAWLADPKAPPPAIHLAASGSDRASAARLLSLCAEAGVSMPASANGLGRAAVVVCALHCAGLETVGALQAAFVIARLPCAVAEGFAARHGRLKDYPTNTPTFEHAFDK